MNRHRSTSLFYIGLAVKVALLFAGGSPYLRDLFVPFVDHLVKNPLSNPWAHFSAEHFPYGSVLLVLIFIPKYIGYLLVGNAALGQGALSLALMKLPLLAMDLALLWVLLQFSVKSRGPILLYYWLNPILIFISYIHGQLDVVAITFVFYSIFFLSRDRVGLSALAAAGAVLSKFHVVAIVPLLLLYLWRSDFVDRSGRRVAGWLLLFVAVVAVGFLPVLSAGRLLNVTVLPPKADRLLGLTLDMGAGRVLLVGLGCLLFVFGRLCLSHYVNLRGLLFGSSLLFGALLLITAPMPGWYHWIVPFLALFYATYYTNHPSLFWAMIVSYVVYFGGLEAGLMNSPLLASLSFTGLQVSLAACLAEIWILVIRPEMPLLGSFKPLMIGIAGDSGTGKNTLSAVLGDVLGEVNSVMLEGDDYHKWDRGAAADAPYTHLHPKANLLPKLADHTLELMQGRFIVQPHYDHATGQFTVPRSIKPNKAVIVQGLHTLYLRQTRRKFDLTIFLNPDPLVQLAWKIRRDATERGRSAEEVAASVEARRTDAERYIRPQAKNADWIIEVIPSAPISRADVVDGKTPPLAVRHILWNDDPVDDLLAALSENGCTVHTESVSDDVDRIAMTVHGQPDAGTVDRLARSVFPNLRQILRNRRPPRWRDGQTGITQLIAIALIKKSQVHAGLR